MKDRKNYKWQDNGLEEAIAMEEENYDLTKLSSNNYEPVDFDVEIEKQTHLDAEQKQKLKKLWIKHKNLFKGTVGKYTKDKVKLKFKENAKRHHQCKPYPVPEMYKDLMIEFLEDLVRKGVLSKRKSAKWLSPMFC